MDIHWWNWMIKWISTVNRLLIQKWIIFHKNVLIQFLLVKVIKSIHFFDGYFFIEWFSDELKYKKICYFTNWAQYRSGLAKFEPEHIDPFLCTHIIYAFAYVSNQTYLITKVEENDEGSRIFLREKIDLIWFSHSDLYRRVNALKKRNPKLKTILGVGGWNMKSHAFSVMVHDNMKRRRFIFDTIK